MFKKLGIILGLLVSLLGFIYAGSIQAAPLSNINVTAGTADTLKAGGIKINNNNAEIEIRITRGAGSPEGVVSAIVGQLYMDNTNGVAYVKATGAGTNTGWTKVNKIVDVTQFGAKGTDANEDSTAFQLAITSLGTSGGVIYIPNGTWLMAAPITTPTGNIYFVGEQREKTIIMNHATLGNNPIFSIIGTVGTHIQNVSWSNLTVRNGTATTGVVGGVSDLKDGIQLKYVDNINFNNVLITEIEGSYALLFSYGSGLNFLNSKIYRITYAGLDCGAESQDVMVDNSTFDTNLGTAANEYLFSTGYAAGDLGVATFLTKRVTVQNSRFLNNPRWHGINSHGGEKIRFLNNYIKNVACGIHYAYGGIAIASHPSTANTDIIISGNHVVKGASTYNETGIKVQGSNQASPIIYIPLRGYEISNNTIDGFGDTASISFGAILASACRDGNITYNHINNYYTAGITLRGDTNNTQILGNEIGTMVGFGAGGVAQTAGIQIKNYGNFRVFIDRNNLQSRQLSATYTNQTPTQLVYIDSGANGYSHVRLGNNNYWNSTTTTQIGGFTASTNYFKDARIWNSMFIAKHEYAYDSNFRPVWQDVDTADGMYSTNVILAMTGTTDGTTNIMTINSGTYTQIPIGARINIAGAGAAMVLDNKRETLVLDTVLPASVSGAVTFTAPTMAQSLPRFVSAIPSGAGNPYLVGDIALFNNPTASNIAGWQCTTSGSPGTWVPIYNGPSINLLTGAHYDINGVQVVGARNTGWTATTGTGLETTTNVDAIAALAISNPPTQAEVTSIRDYATAIGQRLKGLLDALTTHGLIGP